MIKTTKDKIKVYQSEKISFFNGVTHFFSTREGGISQGAFRSLNFGTHFGEAENMIKNLELLNKSLRFTNARFIIPLQTHSDVVAMVDQSNYIDTFENTDALITNLPNLIICIKTADCIPILLFDPVKMIVGAVHAGWRGTGQNIVGKTIKKMEQVYDCVPSNLIAVIGPCISQQNYEVGREVVDNIKPLLISPEKAISNAKKTSDKFCLNLKEANNQLIKQAGIDEENIDSLELCTYTSSDEFFSARRDGHRTGRMINGIGILDNKINFKS
jgi:polyphenol oxidase